MKPITKFYLTTFLWTGIPFGLFMVGLDAIENQEFPLWKFVFHALFFGVFMSATLVSFHKYVLQKNGIHELTEEELKVHQQRTVLSTIPPQELLSKLRSTPFFAAMKCTASEQNIVLRSGITWQSFGERITIRSTSTNNQHYEYAISSTPKISTTLVDYGKNKDNVYRIEQLLTANNTIVQA